VLSLERDFLHDYRKELMRGDTRHGTPALFFHRPELLRFLYTSLPSDVQKRLIPGKAVTDIRTTADGNGLIVTCTDGTIEKGDIVVGADGIHSTVREIITHKRSLSRTPRTTETKPKPFVAKFRCLFGYTTHLIPGLQVRDILEAHSAGTSTQVFVFPDKVLFMIYQKLSHPTTSNESESARAQGDAGEKQGRYTHSDQEEFIKQTGHLHIVSSEVGLKVKDLYNARQWSVLSDSHEGIMEHWHAGGRERMVLVGDAVNKQTPNFGHGWNCGVQDVVVLGNLLGGLVKKKEVVGEGVRGEELDRLFDEYQGMRYGASRTCLEASMTVARMHAWDSWGLWFLDRWVAPVVSDGLWLKIYLKLLGPGPQMANGYVLDFLREKERPKGLVPWVRISRIEMEENGRES